MVGERKNNSYFKVLNSPNLRKLCNRKLLQKKKIYKRFCRLKQQYETSRYIPLRKSLIMLKQSDQTAENKHLNRTDCSAQKHNKKI